MSKRSLPLLLLLIPLLPLAHGNAGQWIMEIDKNGGEVKALNWQMKKEKVEEYDEELGKEMLHLSGCAYAIKDIFLKNAAELADAEEKLAHCVNRGPEKLTQKWGWRATGAIKWQQCDDAENYCVWYLAVSAKRQRIAVVFRGTDSLTQLMEEVKVSIGQNMRPFQESKVNPYFDQALNNAKWKRVKYPLSIWQSFIVELHAIVKRQFPDNNEFSLIFTGHSLGGALSALASAKLAHFIKEKEECKFKWENLLQKGGMEAHLLDSDACDISDQLEYLRQRGKRMGIELYTFGQPRVGNKPFADIFNKLVPRNFRIVNGNDVVPHVPPCEMKKTEKDVEGKEEAEREETCDPNAPNESAYFHHGIEIWYRDGMELENGHKFVKCAKSESAECSNQLFANKCIQKKAFMDLIKQANKFGLYWHSIQNHLFYFGQTVSTIVDAVHLTKQRANEDMAKIEKSIEEYFAKSDKKPQDSDNIDEKEQNDGHQNVKERNPFMSPSFIEMESPKEPSPSKPSPAATKRRKKDGPTPRPGRLILHFVQNNQSIPVPAY